MFGDQKTEMKTTSKYSEWIPTVHWSWYIDEWCFKQNHTPNSSFYHFGPLILGAVYVESSF